MKAKPKSRILWKNTLLGFRRFAFAVTICPRSPRPAAPLPPTPQHPEPGVLRHFLTLPLSQRSRSHELFYYSHRPPPVPPHRAATSTQAPDRHRRVAPAAAAATAPRVRVPSSSEVLPLETRHEKSRQEKNRYEHTNRRDENQRGHARLGADPRVTPSTAGHLSSRLAAPRCTARPAETQLISAQIKNFSGFCLPSPPYRSFDASLPTLTTLPTTRQDAPPTSRNRAGFVSEGCLESTTRTPKLDNFRVQPQNKHSNLSTLHPAKAC